MLVYTVGDTKPDLIFELQADGDALNLSGANVTFTLRKPSGAIVTRPLTVTNVATARVEGSFAYGDLDESSDDPMMGEITVDWGSSLIQHSQEPVEVYVRPEYTEIVT